MNAEDAQIEDAVAVVRARWRHAAKVGVILGTGLSNLADEVDVEATIGYEQLAGFPRSTALAHRGRFVCGKLHGVPAIVMDGRCHLYEGYSCDEITRPIRLMRRLGVERLIVSNAAGGLHPSLCAGDVVLIDSHINMMFRESPLLAARCDPRPSRQIKPLYDRTLIQQAGVIARRAGFAAPRGAYVAVTGPNYETRAEYRFFRRIGGDVVGMSTVPEVLLAAHLGMRVLALSTVTNVALPDAPKIVDANEVVTAAAQAEPKLRMIVAGILAGC